MKIRQQQARLKTTSSHPAKAPVLQEEGANVGKDLHMEASEQSQSDPSIGFEGFGNWETLTGGGSQDSQKRIEKRIAQFSTDDEADESISAQVGSIVNSKLGISTEKDRKKVQKVKKL